jgi:imidazolonepropionase-like amidohydrolase
MNRASYLVLSAVLTLAFVSARSPAAGPPATGGTSPVPGIDDPLALVGGTVIVSPDAQPIHDGVVLVQLGHIQAVGPRASVRLPKGCVTLDCRGATVTAGFWNCDAHFTAPEWQLAETLSVAHFEQQMRAALTRFGFTSVIALGGGQNVEEIQQRIERGGVVGPRILRGGVPIVPVGVTPEDLETPAPFAIPEIPFVAVDNPAQAEGAVESALSHGADFVDVVTGYGDSSVMRPELVRAVTGVARRWGQLVFARPQHAAGTMAAVAGGADVLVGYFSQDTLRVAQIDSMRSAGVSLIAVGALHPRSASGSGVHRSGLFYFQGMNNVGAFAWAGGSVLFGDDGPRLSDERLAAKYDDLGHIGLDWRAILRSLTTAPAERFEFVDQLGVVAVGHDADLCVLEGDPAADAQAFAHLRYTLRGGRVLYDARAEEAAAPQSEKAAQKGPR